MSQEIYIHVHILVETGKFALPPPPYNPPKSPRTAQGLDFDGSDREASLTLIHSEAEEKSTPGLTYIGIKGRRARTGQSSDVPPP